MDRDDLKPAIQALHAALIENERPELSRVA
jgi:hypothetical protein